MNVSWERGLFWLWGAGAVGWMAAFVGRDHEVGLLLERWQRAKEGEGQVVLLSGEAGIGKSRILDTLCERLSLEEHKSRN